MLSANAQPQREAEIDAARGGFWLSLLRLAAPYFRSDERWFARLLLVGVFVLTLLQIGIAVRINVWNKDFFNALDKRDWGVFLGQMRTFALLLIAAMSIAVYQAYVKQLLQLRWRRWLTTQLVDRWLTEKRYYHLNFIAGGVDNPDQRISENAKHAIDQTVEFSLGLLNSVLTLISFTGILWALSGTLNLTISGIPIAIPGYMVFAAILYAGLGSGLTYLVGRPIVGANIRTNAAEADYRFALVRVRENSEAIALINGESDENKGLGNYFGEVLGSSMGLMRSQRRLMWLTSFYASVGWVYPTLVASPRFFSGAITLGVLMQITAAFGQVQTALNWFVDNFPKLAEWRSHAERVLEFDEALELMGEAQGEGGEVTTILLSDGDSGDEVLRFRELAITHIDGNVVIGDANTEIARGEKVLIVGPSGSGKSTLFRAIAGLWPWGAGKIILPDRSKMMFMPQRPYLPLGTVRQVLCYPSSVRRFPIADIKAALRRCGLDMLIDRINEHERWDRVLSGGEQQRLAFGRLLLHKPDWVFMDEATSALDEESQKAMMSLFSHELSGATLISIAHRPGLDAFHDRTLTLVESVAGAKLVTKRRPRLAQRPARRRKAQRRPLKTIVLRRLRSSRAG
ncbi:MAG: ABC transporter ATP-binding protein/permease [Alphaproteobacteria bacterium]|nr:ABC transporter ATP-binding protein/permease [Alphaproteobacteria bacterium]MBV9552499.1 ABC transporter ATP-binding protein/permease [Alphaproteobacteria bacterium]